MSAEQLRREWLDRLGSLVDVVDSFARDAEWSTRRIEKQMKDGLGSYAAPALMMQHEMTRVLLEPIAASAPNAEGVVDLYLMPAYDDLASLYFYDGQWWLHYFPHGEPIAPDPHPNSTDAGVSIRDAKSQPLTKESLQHVLSEMREHAATLS